MTVLSALLSTTGLSISRPLAFFVQVCRGNGLEHLSPFLGPFFCVVLRVCACVHVCVRACVFGGLKMYHFGSLLGLIWRPHNDQFAVYFGRVEQLTLLLFALRVCFGSHFHCKSRLRSAPKHCFFTPFCETRACWIKGPVTGCVLCRGGSWDFYRGSEEALRSFGGGSRQALGSFCRGSGKALGRL